MRISDWSSDVCSSDLCHGRQLRKAKLCRRHALEDRQGGTTRLQHQCRVAAGGGRYRQVLDREAVGETEAIGADLEIADEIGECEALRRIGSPQDEDVCTHPAGQAVLSAAAVHAVVADAAVEGVDRKSTRLNSSH